MDKQRLKNLQANLENPILIKKKENLLYLTGRSFMHGYLLVPPLPLRRGVRGDVVFFGDGLEKVDGMKSDRLKNVGKYLSKNQVLELFSEFTYGEVKYIKFKNPKLKTKVTIKHDPVDYLRQVKDADELSKVKKSMQIVGRVFTLVKKEIRKPNITEIKLAQFIQNSGLKMGAEDLSFPAIVASGANAAVPHHMPSSKKLKAGEPIILDFGFKYKHYCSDFTRTVFLKKVGNKKIDEAYNQVEKAYNESMGFINIPSQPPLSKRGGAQSSPSYFKRGLGGDILAGDVYQKAVDVLAEKHLEKYFIHSLGHGTGLEIHELPNLSPNSKDVLKDQMVFSIEPGVYIPKLGGIRIEDLVYLEKGMVKKFINVSTKLINNIL